MKCREKKDLVTGPHVVWRGGSYLSSRVAMLTRRLFVLAELSLLRESLILLKLLSLAALCLWWQITPPALSITMTRELHNLSHCCKHSFPAVVILLGQRPLVDPYGHREHQFPRVCCRIRDPSSRNRSICAVPHSLVASYFRCHRCFVACVGLQLGLCCLRMFKPVCSLVFLNNRFTVGEVILSLR